MAPERPLVIVFARDPQPGRVKTRLVPVLGPEGAAQLQAAMTEHCLSQLARLDGVEVQLWCDPVTVSPFFDACRGRWRLSLHAQRGDDLGQRMLYAFDSQAYRRPVVLIGTDWPVIDPDLVQEAADALSPGGKEAVFAPARDGGYVMVGLRRPVPELFRDMPWGTDQVMRLTRQRLREQDIDWRELPMQWDVDRPEDLARLRSMGLGDWIPEVVREGIQAVS